MPPPPPKSTLFPYTTLFRSQFHTRARVTARSFEEGMPAPPSAPLPLAQFPDQPVVENPHRPSPQRDRKSTRLNSSHVEISYAVFCLKKKKTKNNSQHTPEPN